MPETKEVLEAEWKKLKLEISEKEHILRNLRQAQYYQQQNEVENIKEKMKIWRTAMEQAVMQLHEKCPEPKPSMELFLTNMRIDPSVIGFDVQTNEFTN